MLRVLHPCPVLGFHDVFLLPLPSMSRFSLLLTFSSLVHFLFSIILFFVSDVLSFFLSLSLIFLSSLHALASSPNTFISVTPFRTLF